MSAIWAIKIAWESNIDFLPQPLVPPALRQNFTIEFYGFTENTTLFTSPDAEPSGTGHLCEGLWELVIRLVTNLAKDFTEVYQTLPELRHTSPGFTRPFPDSAGTYWRSCGRAVDLPEKEKFAAR